MRRDAEREAAGLNVLADTPDVNVARIIAASTSIFSHEFIKPTGVIRDLWDEEENEKVELSTYNKTVRDSSRKAGVDMDFLVDSIQSRMKNKRIKFSDGYVKKGSLTVAPAGLSVNPEPEAYQAIIDAAEARARREDEHKTRLHNRARGLIDVPVIVADEAEINATAHWYEPVVNQPVKGSDRKTLVQRNKEKRQRAMTTLHVASRSQKRMHQQIENVGQIIQELEVAEANQDKRREHIKLMRELKAENTTRTGKHKYVAPFPEVRMEDEVSASGSIRESIHSTQLVKDAFSRLQQRGLLSITKFRPLSRRYALKTDTTRAARNFEAPDVAALLENAQLDAERNPRQFAPSKNLKKVTSKSNKRSREETEEVEEWE